MGGEPFGQVIEVPGEGVGGGESVAGPVRHGGVRGGLRELLGVEADGAPGVLGVDDDGVRGHVLGLGAGGDEGVHVGGGQARRLRPGLGQDRREPGEPGAAGHFLRRGDLPHRGEDGGVDGAVEERGAEVFHGR